MPRFILPFCGDYPVTNDFAHHLAYSKAPGIDWGMPTGTPVTASASGLVAYAHWGTDGGRYVVVRHDDKWRTLYSHLSWFAVGVGERVHQGQLLGLSGSTGHSSGPHLHFAIRRPDGVYVDPAGMVGAE